ELDDSPEAVLAEFCKREWCDGLPIVPPTEARVRAMLGGRDPEKSIGAMPPLWRQATLEKLAVNAVMAGCEAAYFAIIVAAVEAMLDPVFNLYGVQATTHPVAPLVVVNGPYGKAIGVHGGQGCFGPGFRANATIGRAVRLILLNVGGAWPGRGDMATQGSPAKFSYCIAENEDASPWAPMCDGDTVTVYGGEPPHNVNDHVSTSASSRAARASTRPSSRTARSAARFRGRSTPGSPSYRASSRTSTISALPSSTAPRMPRPPSRSWKITTPSTVAVNGSSSETRPAAAADTEVRPVVYAA